MSSESSPKSFCSDTTNPSKENKIDTSKTPSMSGKRNKSAALIPKNSTTNFDDIGGMDKILSKIFRMFMHHAVPTVMKEMDCKPPSGILFHGVPGCGKTYLTRAIAGEMGIPIFEVSATELVREIPGESERMIRDLFGAALATGRCILFIDEIDAIGRKRETNENAMMGRMVTQVIKSFDELKEKDPDGNVMVIGATNMPDALDIGLRRGSRFTHEIAIGIPDEEARLGILKLLCKKTPLEPDFDFNWLAHHTPGYVAADLDSLSSIAKMKAALRMRTSLAPDQTEDEFDVEKYLESGKWLQNLKCPEKNLIVTLKDFKLALKDFVPTSKREGFASVPDATWDEIGSYEDIKETIKRSIVERR